MSQRANNRPEKEFGWYPDELIGHSVELRILAGLARKPFDKRFRYFVVTDA